MQLLFEGAGAWIWVPEFSSERNEMVNELIKKRGARELREKESCHGAFNVRCQSEKWFTPRLYSPDTYKTDSALFIGHAHAHACTRGPLYGQPSGVHRMQILKQKIQHATLRAELCVQRTESDVQSNENDFVLFANQSICARVLPCTCPGLEAPVWCLVPLSNNTCYSSLFKFISIQI